MSLKKLFRILLGIQFAFGLGLALLTVSLFLNQDKLSHSQAIHFQSYLLADELRQSSDDLTRLARTYVTTGNEEYEREYWTILDIRDGKSPRPVAYNRIYWDFISATGQKPRPDGATISLRELMVKEGFTEAELEKLTLSQKYSDELVKTERIAMNAVKGLFDDGAGNFTVKKKSDHAMAIRLMNDEAYHKHKANIMKPIDDFYTMFAERTAGDVTKYEQRSMNLLLLMGTLIIVIMAMFGYFFVILLRQIIKREQAEAELHKSNENLEVKIEERTSDLNRIMRRLEARNLKNGLLSEMREFLQASPTIQEVGPVITRSIKKLFPDSDGALFLLSPSKTDLEITARWGDFPEDMEDNTFPPDACWGLRRGGMYTVDDVETGLHCSHLKHLPSSSYACLPMMAKGEVLGLLHIRKRSGNNDTDALQWISDFKDVSSTLSEMLSLSISNIRLRETLSMQSIKDPLTGMYNRRYMEENFLREISRAARKQNDIGVLMIDIDHFKTFNDLQGHAAGDAVLVDLAGFFKARMRGSDIACRYGGEEFVLLFSESSIEHTSKRASQMVEEIKTLRVSYGGQLLGPITLSIGVAVYPNHGKSPEDLLQAADTALYRAKQEGRDRVAVA